MDALSTKPAEFGPGILWVLHDVGMTRLLPAVLTPDDLPLAELTAARLDGDVVSFDECFLATDATDTLTARADALLDLVGARVVADTASALWLFGIRPDPPRMHTVAIDRSHRSSCPASRRVTVHETRLLPGDVSRAGSMRVTTWTRTAYDVARADSFGAAERRDLQALLERGTTAFEVRQRLAVVPNLPGRQQALKRLAAVTTLADAPQPLLAGAAPISWLQSP